MNAVGVWFYSVSTQRYLYLMRRDVKNPHCWGLPGGKVHCAESLLDAMQRECREELGQFPDYIRLIPLEQFTSADEVFHYHTFFCSIAQEFLPRLNHEHLGYAWIDSSAWPRPMHPGLWTTVNFAAVQHKIQQITADQMSQ